MPLGFCQICSEEFYIRPSYPEKGWGEYCSKECQFKSQLRGKFVKCLICSKEIYRSIKMLQHSNSGNFFCTKSCQTRWRNEQYSGKNSLNWKNGIRVYRNILERSGVKKICVFCKSVDKRVLVVHHKDHNRFNNEITNLVWLCLNCHYLVHHYKEVENKLLKIHGLSY